MPGQRCRFISRAILSRPWSLSVGLLFLASLATEAQIFAQTAPLNPPPPALYSAAGVSTQDVRQGSIASCYFYATIGAIAKSKPSSIKDAVVALPNGQFRVNFLDGKSETVTSDDAMYARANGFDRSSAFWVAVIFRAYAQRTLRYMIGASIDATDIPGFLKEPAKAYIANDDTILLAYDRAIRDQVYQNAVFDSSHLRTHLTAELDTLHVSKPVQKQVLDYASDKKYFDTFAKLLAENGEVFGAYRAVGQGGIPKSVFAAISGDSRGEYIEVDNLVKTREVLSRIHAGGLGAVASSRDSIPADMLARTKTDPVHPYWYVSDHAYTVLDYDPTADAVKLRNPWGDHPDPDGIFTISSADFAAAYLYVTLTKPAATP